MLQSHCTDNVFFLFNLFEEYWFFSCVYSSLTDQVSSLLLVLRFCFSSFSSVVFAWPSPLPYLFCLYSCMGRDGKNWNHRAVTQVGSSLIRIWLWWTVLCFILLCRHQCTLDEHVTQTLHQAHFLWHLFLHQHFSCGARWEYDSRGINAWNKCQQSKLRFVLLVFFFFLLKLFIARR